jgi:hypothetical protein
MKTRTATQVARASNEPVPVSRTARRQPSPASTALGASPRMTAQRQALHAAVGSLAGPAAARPASEATKSLRPLAVSSQTVLQAFWKETAKGVEWVNAPNPTTGYVDTGRTRRGQTIWKSIALKESEDKVALEKKAKEEEKEKERQKELEKEKERKKSLLVEKHVKRSRPKTSRSAFSKQEKERLATIPKVLTRGDDNPTSTKNSRGQGKAHLVSKGLKTAGEKTLTATEQQDQLSPNKGQGNRISSTAPLTTGTDRANTYGTGGGFSIKAKKLERARLRGKPDAQNVRVHTTGEILGELDKGPKETASGKKRETLKAFARKDREFHHSVDFHSPDDQEFYIPNRFLIRDDMPEIHDSDSESESEDEAEDPIFEPAVDLKEETEVADEEVQDEEKDTALDTVSATPALVTPVSGGARKKKRNRNKNKNKKKGTNGSRK